MHLVEIFNVKKLQEICDPFNPNKYDLGDGIGVNPWNLSEPILKKELQFYIDAKIETPQYEFFQDKCFNRELAKVYHYARIAYFINHGWKDEIFLKFGKIENGDPWINWAVINGNHRYCAALFLEHKTILGAITLMEDNFNYKYFVE